MREIKFKGYSVKQLVSDSQWVEGFGVGVIEYANGNEDIYIVALDGEYIVHKESVGQYTALKTKMVKRFMKGIL